MNKLKIQLSADEIRNLGFEWPKHTIITKYCALENDIIDIEKSLDNLRQSHVFYQKQITAAYNFKIRTGADYSDFTDKFDDYVRMKRLLSEAISYLEQILAAYLK